MKILFFLVVYPEIRETGHSFSEREVTETRERGLIQDRFRKRTYDSELKL